MVDTFNDFSNLDDEKSFHLIFDKNFTSSDLDKWLKDNEIYPWQYMIHFEHKKGFCLISFMLKKHALAFKLAFI